MKQIFLKTSLIFVCAAAASGLAGVIQIAAANNRRRAKPPVAAAAQQPPRASFGAPFVSPSAAPTPPAIGKPAANNQKNVADNALPRKVDDQTAVSPVYKINSKYCINKDGQGSEGQDILRKCKAYGDYILSASGFDYRINYGIESADPKKSFLVMLFPLETGAAAKYARADLYDQKLADAIEWRLNDKGKPYAVIVHAYFYKNTGSAKTFLNPKNKIAEFILVRGLVGYEDLKEDLPVANTPFNPDEQARAIAAKFWESKQK